MQKEFRQKRDFYSNYENEKKTSCGILIFNEDNELLLCHVSGTDYYDIPKGVKERNETEIECAIRECREETGLEFKEEDLKKLGLHEYIPNKKDLYLFYTFVNKKDIDMSKLKCSSYFENDGYPVLEVNGYEFIHCDDVPDHVNIRLRDLLDVYDIFYALNLSR
jgi:putative (di)nucleoside polyphosphate hydrolase